MYPIKQSTAETIVFFVYNANGDGVTGLADGGFTKRISKGSGAFAAMTATITEMENGWYSFPLSSAHTDTTGVLTISFLHASAKQINLQWRVSARTFDELASPTNITAGTISTVSGNVAGSVGSVGTGGLTATSFASAALNAIADALLDRNMAAGVDSGTNDGTVRTLRQAARVLRNKVTVTAGTAVVTKEDDSTTSWTASVTTAAGNPISGVDPAS